MVIAPLGPCPSCLTVVQDVVHCQSTELSSDPGPKGLSAYHQALVTRRLAREMIVGSCHCSAQHHGSVAERILKDGGLELVPIDGGALVDEHDAFVQVV